MSSNNQNGKKQHSLQDYRQAVKILKLNALQIVDQNKEIETKIEAMERLLSKKPTNRNLIDQAVVLSSKTDILQKYQQQKQGQVQQQRQKEQKKKPQQTFTDEVEANNSAQPTSNLIALKKEQLLKDFKAMVTKKCLNYEMIFRCCDKDYKGMITVEDFKQFISSKMSLNTSLTLEQITFLAQCFDEDCNGTITLEEYNKCLSLYNLNESPNKLLEQRALEKEVMFKLVKLFDTLTKSERTSFATAFDSIVNKKGGNKSLPSSQSNLLKPSLPSRGDRSPLPEMTVGIQQIQEFLEDNKCMLKDMEIFAMSRVLDPLRTGFVEKKQFVRELNSYYRMLYEIDIDREMQSFAELLKKFKVDPIHVFKIADIEDSKIVKKTILIKAIVKLAPRINAQIVEHFLSIIDSNKNGEIDENEYYVALSQDEQNALFDFQSDSQLINGSFEKQKILDKFHTFMTKNHLNQQELFAKIDRNGNKEISLLELKFALLDLGFELSQITQVMRVFDVNQDQKIDYNEFAETLSNGKMVQHGFEKEIQEVNKIRKSVQAQQEQRSQAELSNVIQQASLDEKVKSNKDVKQPQPTGGKQKNKIKDNVPDPDFIEEQQQNQIEIMKKSIPNIPDVSIIQTEEDHNNHSFEEDQLSQNDLKNKYSITINKNGFDNDNQNIQEQNSREQAEEQEDNYDQDFDDGEHDSPVKNNESNQLGDNIFKNVRKQSSKLDLSYDDDKPNLNKSHNSSSKQKSVKFSLFEEAAIEEFILNEENLDFNKFYEDLENKEYKDEEFPPVLASITKDVKTFEKAKNIIWKRASDIYKDLKVFFERAEPDDIKQGGLGDCYFLSSLSVIAERENLITRLFVTKNPNPSKVYSVWICKDSEWVQVILDDFLPCRKEDSMPVFSSANGDELWVMLLEKCYAKIYGAYDKIEAGQTVEAIKDLTGAPGKSIKNDDVNMVWDFILTNERKNYLLTCGSQSDDRGLETKKESGIVSSHAYGILDAQEVKTAKGIARLIKIRNPWGSMEWQGDWSDSSKLWTKQIREQLKYFDSKDDGIFWMDVKDYIKEFSETSVNYLHDDYFYSWYKFKDLKNQSALLQFVVNRETHCYIMLSQKSDRHFAKTKTSYSYSMLKQFLFEINPTTLQPIRYINDAYTPFREGYVEATLTQGTYCMAIEAAWIQNEFNDAVVSIYSKEKVNLQVNGFEMHPNEEFGSYLSKAVVLKDFAKSPTVKENKYEETPEVIRYHEQFGGYLFFKYVNESTKFTLEEEVQVNGEGVELIPREEEYESKEGNTFSITVPPKSTKMALYKLSGDGMKGIQFTIGTGYIMNENESTEDLIEKFLSDPDKGDQRQHQGKNVEYYFKVHQYNEGFVLLYQNKTKNLVGMEDIEFENNNLEIVNSDLDSANNKAKFDVRPGQHYAIILKKADKSKGCGLGYSEVGTQFKKA